MKNYVDIQLLSVYLENTTRTVRTVIRTTIMTTRIPMTAMYGMMGSCVDPNEPNNAIIYLSDVKI